VTSRLVAFLLVLSAVSVHAQDRSAADSDALREQAGVVSVADVCPPARRDALCRALHAAEEARDRTAAAQHHAEAGRLVAELIAGDAHAPALRDPAVRLYVRDRSHALLVHAAVAPHASVPPADWEARVDGFLARYFPIYAVESFTMAHAFRPAAVAGDCGAARAALVIFPGVLRSAERQEFTAQAERIARSFPCLEIARVESDDFAPLDANARAGQAAVAALDARFGPLPLHLVGYSQGVTNALATLASDAALRARTRSFFALNSAAHGSELIDVAMAALDDPLSSPRPVTELLEDVLETLGLSMEELDPVSAGEFIAHVRGGLESLTTRGTAAFWAEHGDALPADILYTSFRSVITDEHANLPPSSVATYAIVAAAAPDSPFNDMQVRLARHALGGPMADVEVLSHVAEGNHWQWALGPNDLHELLIPPDMLTHVPREALWLAHVQTLYELGLL
jgi:hypothetical protein